MAEMDVKDSHRGAYAQRIGIDVGAESRNVKRAPSASSQPRLICVPLGPGWRRWHAIAQMAFLAVAAVSISGCMNVYRSVDTKPDGAPATFRGIKDYVRDGRTLLVVQVHGIGDHSQLTDCGAGSENLKLQDEIVKLLGYSSTPKYGAAVNEVADQTHQGSEPHPIKLGGKTILGGYSVRRFTGPNGYGDIYFSCVTWGEMARALKRGMLELDENYDEHDTNSRHRAVVNGWAKRFVNKSLSDTAIYLGTMGPYVRRVVWEGIVNSSIAHAQGGRTPVEAAWKKSGNADELVHQLDAVMQPGVVIISDSLGSRIIFDLLCEHGIANCGRQAAIYTDPFNPLPPDIQVVGAIQENLARSVNGIYMLANQLPLLELAYVSPPHDGQSLDDVIDGMHCFVPARALSTDSEQNVQIVAFTDANDVLSYHLSDRFKARCGEIDTYGLAMHSSEFINVTVPAAKLRWAFVYSDLEEAHSTGLKKSRAVAEYITNGQH